MIKFFLNKNTSSIVIKFKNKNILYLTCSYKDMTRYLNCSINFNNTTWVKLNDH